MNVGQHRDRNQESCLAQVYYERRTLVRGRRLTSSARLNSYHCAMSFFRSSSGATNTPPPSAASYNRILDGSDNSPQGHRSTHRVPPLSAQHNPPQHLYNDPSSALFEKTSYARKAPPRSGGRHVFSFIYICLITNAPIDSFGVVGSPSDALALTNCLIVHPSDFPQGQHVLINGTYALTVR